MKHDPICHKCEVWCKFATEQQNRPLFKNNTGCFGLTDNDELITRPLPKAPSHQGCDSEQGGSLDPCAQFAGPKKRGNKSCKFKSFHRWKFAMQVVKYSAVSSLHHIFDLALESLDFIATKKCLMHIATCCIKPSRCEGFNGKRVRK